MQVPAVRESVEHPRSWKKYHFTEAEFKQLLGITWPGGILKVNAGWPWCGGVEITMSVQPEELPRNPQAQADAQECAGGKPKRWWQR